MRMTATVKNYAGKMMWGAALCAMMAGQALALDGQAFMQRLESDFKKNQISLKYENINVQGANIVVDGVEAVLSEKLTEGSDTSFLIGTVTFNDVVEASDGSYKIEEVVVNDIDREADGLRVRVSGIGATKMYLPPEGQTISFVDQLPYERAGIENLTLTLEGKTIYTFSGAEVRYAMRNFLENDFSIEHFTFDATAIPDMKQGDIAVLNQMGYNGLFEGRLDFGAVWDIRDGNGQLGSSNTISVKDVGTLHFNFDFNGITENWMHQVTKLVEQLQASGTSEQATQLAILGLMQQLEVRSLVVGFDDDGLTNKIIDYFAGTGVPKETFIGNVVQNVEGIASMMLGKADFVGTLTSEVGTFLNNPKSIEISSWPPNPVPFAMISATAMTEPRDLLGVLYVDVKAKQ